MTEIKIKKTKMCLTNTCSIKLCRSLQSRKLPFHNIYLADYTSSNRHTASNYTFSETRDREWRFFSWVKMQTVATENEYEDVFI
jgi:hypothetical protein